MSAQHVDFLTLFPPLILRADSHGPMCGIWVCDWTLHGQLLYRSLRSEAESEQPQFLPYIIARWMQQSHSLVSKVRINGRIFHECFSRFHQHFSFPFNNRLVTGSRDSEALTGCTLRVFSSRVHTTATRISWFVGRQSKKIILYPILGLSGWGVPSSRSGHEAWRSQCPLQCDDTSVMTGFLLAHMWTWILIRTQHCC